MKHEIINIDYLKNKEPKYSLFKELIDSEFPFMGLNNMKVLDLGAGHCRYSIIASDKFAREVIALDARNVRIPENLPDNVKFMEANVMEIEDSFYAEFDLIFCFGLLYHLSALEQVNLLKSMRKSKGQVWVDTHCCADNALNIVLESGYLGTHYQEASSIGNMIKNPRASVTTLVSFWPTKKSLLKMFKAAGFELVKEISPEHYPNRTFWLLS